MNIGIIGGGSIGLLVSGFLSLKHNITIYVQREEQKNAINRNGLIIGERKTSRVRSLLINELSNEDCLIICVKQPQLKLLIPILHSLGDKIPLIFLQNGMGHIEFIKSLDQTIYVGIVEHGAIRKSDNRVLHTGKGLIRLATFKGHSNQLNDLLKALNVDDFPIKKSSHWKQLLSEKLVVNAVINPLTTLFGIKNRQINEDPHVNYLARQLCKEAATVLGMDVNEEWSKVKEIAKLTGDNTSSMLVDMNNKRETELEAITGYLLAHSNQDIPYTSFVYHSIKALERKNGIY